MKRLLVGCLLAALAVPAFAVVGTIDDVPASTLLLPYFEVDLNNPNGVTTLFSINNASAAAVLTHVVLWTDLSVHVLDFNVYLTGYDVQTINLRDIIVYGNLPITADDGNDGGDTISPQGPVSQDIPYPNCDGILPYDNPALDATYLFHVQSSLTGGSSPVFFEGLCSGYDHNDNIARGYVTIDTVNTCSTDFPQDLGYFVDGGLGTASNQNVIWGDYFYVNPEQNFAQGETLVHIESDNLLDITNYTHYYRYSAGADNREGLGNVFATRFVDGGGFTGGTDLLVWRDSKYPLDPFSCNFDWQNAVYPLGQAQIVVFDEEENFEVPEGCQISPCPPTFGITPFPIEAQRTEVGGPSFPVSPAFGWIFLNLNFTNLSPYVPFDPLMQNWVTTVMDADGRYSVGYDAIQLGNVTDADITNNPLLPVNN